MTYMKNIHMLAIKYLTYMVLHKRKIDNKQASILPLLRVSYPLSLTP